MFISFAVTNHRSLRDRSELSFVAERSSPGADRAHLPVPGFDLEVVPAVAIVGANGSGKSNVVDALAYARSAVGESQARWPATSPPPRAPFLTRHGPSPEPSTYELTFAIDDAVYEYEFSVDSRAVTHEQLAYAPNGPRSRTRLFTRRTRASGAVDIEFGRRLKGPRAAAEAATRANSLFLSSAAQNNHRMLLPIWRWLVEGLRTATPHDRHPRAGYTAGRLLHGDRPYRERLRKFVASADLGIEDVNVREVELPEEMVRQMRELIGFFDADSTPADDETLVDLRTQFTHRGDVGLLDLGDESAGTKAWFEWAAPVIDTLDAGAVLAADELDAHLNELLAGRIVSSFQAVDTNRHGAQLLFATQDPYVLTVAELGRDQVWVAEKSLDGGTSLVPVTDFHPRRSWEVGRAYRHGRFGGLPVIDDDDLLEALSGTGAR